MKNFFSLFAFCAIISCSYAQVGINNPKPAASAVLDLTATDKGLLTPRMTTAQREAIKAPANALLVFDTDLNVYCIYSEPLSMWLMVNPWKAEAKKDGNVILNTTGNIGIGTNNPTKKLDVAGDIGADNAAFKNDIQAANGNFTNNITATGDVTAENGYFKNQVKAKNGSFTDKLDVSGNLNAANVNATNGNFSNNITAGSANINNNITVGGDISAANAKISNDVIAGGNISATNGTFSNNIKASNADINNNITAGGDVSAVNGKFSNSISAASASITNLDVKNITGLPPVNSVPPGAIIMWHGDIGSIPQGWALCNGSNGTPDLRGRFVAGYDDRSSDPGNGIWDQQYNSINTTGGEKAHTLTVNEMPSHTHSSQNGYGSGESSAGNNLYGVDKTGTGNVEIGATGGGQAHENRPPYYVLAYIMKL